MKFTAILALWICCCTAYGQSKELCVTIDDLPVAGGDQRDIRAQQAVTDALLDALVKHRVPAIGFVVGQKLYTNDTLDARKTELLDRWIAHGMELGNHTYGHKDYNAVSFDEMSDDVVNGERALSGLMKRHGIGLRYFRQPYLHRGNSKGKADSLAAFLAARGAVEAPVTIDNGDWIFALAYYKACTARDSARMREIGSGYVDYMERKIAYYESRSRELFGYEMKQVLLIHASRLNADWFDSLAQMIERRQYAFVPLARVLGDPAYRTADAFYRKGGISWIDRWALTMGKTKEFFKDEPSVPKPIMEAAGVDSE